MIELGGISQSTDFCILKDIFYVTKESKNELIVALAGNPNVGKSTVFNSLTGLNQHTGNWSGKTVTNAQGKYKYKDENFILVDIPGTYSLMASSAEEEVARDFVCFGNPDVTVIVVDATCLERNLNLVLQTIEITNKVVVCVNLMDEAKRKKIKINLAKLSHKLGVPVIGTNARRGEGLEELMDTVYNVALGRIINKGINITYNDIIEKAIGSIQPYIKEFIGEQYNSRWIAIKLLDSDNPLIDSLNRFLGLNLLGNEVLKEKINESGEYLLENNIDKNILRDDVVTTIIHLAEKIAESVVGFENKNYNDTDRKIDNILTSKVFGFPIMLGLLGVIFWITIQGANIPSQMLADFLFGIEEVLTSLFMQLSAPDWIRGLFIEGMYRTLAWVVAVMLPPMAIFFPLFTLLEDLGYLPRVAFNLDKFFKKACAHGKQALTMCMGFGCNAVGVIGCRIIDSPRERLIAIITNNFVPCNGRFPTLIAISSIFICGSVSGIFQSLVSALTLLVVIVFGIVMTLIISKILSITILKGLPSSFILELPPYRKPQIGKILIRSVFDRTLFVLGRSIAVAAPAGLIIWILANVMIDDRSLFVYGANFLQPFANLIGLDGYILMAFIIGLPANEIVVPIIIMSYMSAGSMMEVSSLEQLRNLFISHGWTSLTGVCVMLFSLMHWPCATTLWTIRKETRSIKWTLVSFLVPTIAGIIVCLFITQTVRLIGTLIMIL